MQQVLAVLPTYPDGNADTVAVPATAVARHLEADLTALLLIPDFQKVSSPLGNLLVDVSTLAGEARTRAQARADALKTAFGSAAGHAGVALRVAERDCPVVLFGEEAARAARYHDLAVLGLGADDPVIRSVTETVVFGAGRPVVLVPERAEAAGFRHVMIAWDGSRVAARAVGDARDFLRRAAAVSIVSVVDEKALDASQHGERLADALARQGIRATAVQIKGGSRLVTQTLHGHLQEIGADMLVMGAFGHSRVRDFVLGGATAGILRNLQVPTLLSH